MVVNITIVVVVVIVLASRLHRHEPHEVARYTVIRGSVGGVDFGHISANGTVRTTVCFVGDAFVAWGGTPAHLVQA